MATVEEQRRKNEIKKRELELELAIAQAKREEYDEIERQKEENKLLEAQIKEEKAKVARAKYAPVVSVGKGVKSVVVPTAKFLIKGFGKVASNIEYNERRKKRRRRA